MEGNALSGQCVSVDLNNTSYYALVFKSIGAVTSVFEAVQNRQLSVSSSASARPLGMFRRGPYATVVNNNTVVCYLSTYDLHATCTAWGSTQPSSD
jgi:hypothetical protein